MNMVQMTLLLLLACAAGCSSKPAQSVADTSNAEFKVELCFEHDGVKVYRFYTGHRWIYYTDARGKTAWTETHTTGKITHQVPVEVETVGETPAPSDDPPLAANDYPYIKDACEESPEAKEYVKRRMAETGGELRRSDWDKVVALRKPYMDAFHERQRMELLKELSK